MKVKYAINIHAYDTPGYLLKANFMRVVAPDP